jgi:hypothetical protein
VDHSSFVLILKLFLKELMAWARVSLTALTSTKS